MSEKIKFSNGSEIKLVPSEGEPRGISRKGEWISVKERLPKLEKTVLVWDGGEMESGWLVDSVSGLSWCLCGGDNYQSLSSITHWMELPEPPKVEEECPELEPGDFVKVRHTGNAKASKSGGREKLRGSR